MNFTFLGTLGDVVFVFSVGHGVIADGSGYVQALWIRTLKG